VSLTDQQRREFVGRIETILDSLGVATTWEYQYSDEQLGQWYFDVGDIAVVLMSWTAPTPIAPGYDFDLGTEIFWPQEYTLRIFNLGNTPITINSVNIGSEVNCVVPTLAPPTSPIPVGGFTDHTISVTPITLGEVHSFQVSYDTNLGVYPMPFHGTFFDVYQTETLLGVSAEIDVMSLGDSEVVATLAGLLPADAELIPTRVVYETVQFAGVGTITTPPRLNIGTNAADYDNILEDYGLNGVSAAFDKHIENINAKVPQIDDGSGTVTAKVAQAAVVTGGTPTWTVRARLYGFFREDY